MTSYYYRFCARHDLLLEPTGTLVEDGEELLRQPLEQPLVGVGVDVVEPALPLARHRDLVVGPLARQVDAHARHDGRRVAQAHRGQVQAVNRQRQGGLRNLVLSETYSASFAPVRGHEV